MTPDQAGAAWLSECWKPCPELPIGERLAKRKNDAAQQLWMAAQAVDSSVEVPIREAS